jgi:HK97 family phage major capsid protein
MATPAAESVQRIESRVSELRQQCEEFLTTEQRAHGDTLTPSAAVKWRAMSRDLKALEKRAAFERSELERCGHLPANLQSAADHYARKNSTMTTTQESRRFDLGTVYRSGGRDSYLRDLMRVSLTRDTDGQSAERLRRHAQETADTEYRDLSRVDGSGGYAVPPAWLMSQYVEYARPGMAFASILQQQELPGGTDSINIPKILSGTKTAVQTADNQPIAKVDLTDTFINSPVRTIAGGQSVAIQLLDQSPIAFDQVIFNDLTADHSMQLDQQCLSGTGTSGQILGVLNTPSIGSIPIAGAGQPSIANYYSAIANAVQTIHSTRFASPQAVVCHPRRWGHLLSLLDQNNRPLFQPSDTGVAYNPAGILTNVAPENVVGRVAGLPIVVDANIPTNLGAGSNEDVIIVLRSSDVVLWRSGVRARVLPELGAQSLTVWLDLYSYIALGTRYPQSVCTVTGLLPPSF